MNTAVLSADGLVSTLDGSVMLVVEFFTGEVELSTTGLVVLVVGFVELSLTTGSVDELEG